MGRLHFHCPRCQVFFAGILEPHTEAFPCPGCTWNLAEAGKPWFLFRRQQRFGPYSWPQLQDLAGRGQLAGPDLLTTVEDMPQPDSDLTMPKLVPLAQGQTTEDILSETALGEGMAAGPLSMQGLKLRPHLTLSLGDFQILRKLGSGGMGAVYLAYQRSQDRRVALKMLSPALAGQTGFVFRFYREALVLSQLNHPNIVPFFGAGEERGIPFFAMEYIEGFSTAVLLQRLGKPLAVPDALHITMQCLAALRYAHGQNIVHRDIKPENILITSLSKVKIADLGLAKPLDEDLSLTESGLALGTPKFMAPEQSHNAKHADHRSDIFALGGVLYFFLTGRAPFEGTTAGELLMAKVEGRFSPLRKLNADVPVRLGLIVDKMLAKNPKHRYQSCGELVRDLDDLRLAGEHLGFNPLHIVPLAQLQGPARNPNLVEILLIHDDNADILMTQQALEERAVPSNLNVVQNGMEGRAFLRKEGKYNHAPEPDLIVLGSQLEEAGVREVLEVLEEIAGNPLLLKVPVIALPAGPDTEKTLWEYSGKINLNILQSAGLGQFHHFLDAIQGVCLTVVERGRG